jgi:hypothetical protein
MPETERLTFSYTELATILVKQSKIHEGHWGIYLEFGFQATNIRSESPEMLLPAVIVPVTKIGLQKFPEANSLTVDATKVNPAMS